MTLLPSSFLLQLRRRRLQVVEALLDGQLLRASLLSCLAVAAAQAPICLPNGERKTWTSLSAMRPLQPPVGRDMAFTIQSAMAKLRIGIIWNGSGPTRSSNTSGSSRKTITSCLRNRCDFLPPAYNVQLAEFFLLILSLLLIAPEPSRESREYGGDYV